MALEQATIVLDTEWRLISNSNAGGLRIRSPRNGYTPMVYFGDSAPAASAPGVPVSADQTWGDLGTSKAYARSTGKPLTIIVQRTVDAGNPANPTLQTLEFGTLEFGALTIAGTEIGAISKRTAGATVELERPTADLALNTAGDKLLVGGGSIGSGEFENALIERMAGASNSPKRTPFKYTVTKPASILTPGAGGGVVPPVDTTPPTITSAIAFSQAENAALVITLAANEAVTWAKIGGTDAAAFTLDAAAGTLTLAGKDFDVPSDSDGNNTFGVQIRATDAAGNASAQTITVTITNLFDTPRQPLIASSVTMAYNAANGTKVLDLPPLVEGEARSVSVSWLTPDSATGDVFRNAMTGPAQSTSEQQIPVDVTTTVGGANPIVTRFTVVVPAVGGVTKLPPNPRFAVMGDSIFAGSDTRNLTEVIATVSRSRMQAGIGARLAQGGRTMQDMLNEILLGGGTQMGAATAQKLDVLIFNGGTNDLAPGSGGTPRTLDEMKADHQSIVDLAKASGVKVVARSTIPRTKTVDDSTSKRQMFNAWLRTRTDIVLGDVENTFDPNDLVFANSDGIHATINGVIHSYAAVIVAALEPYFDTSFDATAADPANLDADCRITGTGGTIGAGIASDSTVANGWTVANASTATVRVDTIDGRMRVTASGNASAVASITLQNSIPISGNFTPGKNIRATQKARIARASQDAGPIGVRLLTSALGTFGGFLSTTYEAATGPLTTILDGVMQMIPKRWSGGGSPSVLETITVSVAAGAVDFVLDIGPGNALFSEPVAYCPPDLVPGRAVPIVVASASSGNTTNAVEFGAWYGGGYTFTFQHFKNGAAISGATGRTYVQPTSGATGDYFCEVTCTNALGSKTFRTPTITVA